MDAGYTALMLLAIATGAVLTRRSQSHLGLTSAERLGIGIGGFCGAMLAAKLPFVLASWDGLVSGAPWWDSGKTIIFGLVGGYLGVEVAKYALEIQIKTGDSVAVPVAVAVAVGRLACFRAGCCYGTVTSAPWGVDFGDGQARHPAQLYEALFHLGMAGLLYILWTRGLLRLQLFKLYVICYLLYRFATEYIRPEPPLLWGLTFYQWSALVFLPVFVWLWRRDRPTAMRASVAAAGV